MKKKKTDSIIAQLIQKVGIIKIAIIVGVLVLGIGAFAIPILIQKDMDPKIEVSTTLSKILEKSDLSTFQVTYNGVAKINDNKNPKEVSYYVAYKAKTNAGFNVKELKYDINKENKEIIISIPKIKLHDPFVDIESLDYIFYDNDKDELGVSEEAYKACCTDVKKESEKETAIYEIAKENAKNLIKGLAEPFVENMEGNYKLVIK